MESKNNRTQEIYEDIARDKLDVGSVTMKEWLEVCFLAAMDGTDTSITQHVTYGGNLYTLRVYVEQVNPNQPVRALRNEQ